MANKKVTKKETKKMNKDAVEKKYWAQKAKLSTVLDNATLQNYKILSEAQKLGKKAFGTSFTLVKLSEDMDMPFSTVRRCLSLNKCNKKTWALVKAKKISVFKVAMALQSKSVTYQDEVIKLIIEDNLSTYQIKTLKVKNLADVRKEKARLASENGYSRKSSAHSAMINTINKLQLLLLMDKSHLPTDKINDIKKSLRRLNSTITTYLK